MAGGTKSKVSVSGCRSQRQRYSKTNPAAAKEFAMQALKKDLINGHRFP
jgi:hypothetical protein